MTDPSATNLSLLSSAVAAVVARAAPAIVSVHSHRSRASGFIWKPNLVVTADEALAHEGDISIELSDGTVREARIAGRDHTTDVALLRFDTKDDARDIAPIKLSPDVPKLGSLAVVVATERGIPTAALGAVSLVGGRWRSLRGGEIDARVELDVRLRNSHQGGVVLDASDNAIGMAVLGPRRVIVIPSATIERVAGRLETHGRIARGYLGLGLQPVKLDDGIGAMVMNVDKSGPSSTAGIRQGDVIVEWNDDRISGVRSLLQALGPDSVGSAVEVTVRRAGEPVRLKLTIGERPET
jgi:S1-C subfamily serine protease